MALRDPPIVGGLYPVTFGKPDRQDCQVMAAIRTNRFFDQEWRHLMKTAKRFSPADAKRIGDALGIDWVAFNVEQFQAGLEVELEHGARDPLTNVTNDDEMITGKIALAHLKEFPDYYSRLAIMEKQADEYRTKV